MRPVWKLYWNDAPGASLDYDGKTYSLDPDHLHLISPLTNYVPRCPTEVNHFYIHFKLPAEYALMPKGIWRVDRGPWAWDEISNTVLSGLATYSDKVKILSLVCFALSELPASPFDQEHPSPLQAVFSWVDEHLDQDCSNPVLARLCNLSVDTLVRYFQAETQRTPQAYVRNLRISRGALLLRQGSMTIEQIADECGFYDRAHFHRLFRMTTGMTPIEYRRDRQLREMKVPVAPGRNP